MSGGMRDKTANGAEGRDAVVRVKWDAPQAPPIQEGGAEASDSLWHLQVELPSRRWYIEAAGEATVPE